MEANQLQLPVLLCRAAIHSPFVDRSRSHRRCRPIRRFFKIALPLIAPVSFFLLVVNLVYAFFDTFPVIDAATSGGPVQATTTLIYKIYREVLPDWIWLRLPHSRWC